MCLGRRFVHQSGDHRYHHLERSSHPQDLHFAIHSFNPFILSKMRSLIVACCVASFIQYVSPYPHSNEQEARSSPVLNARDGPPPRPEGIGERSFHGSDFVNMFDRGYGPALDAAPVWLFSRTGPENVNSQSNYSNPRQFLADSRPL